MTEYESGSAMDTRILARLWGTIVVHDCSSDVGYFLEQRPDQPRRLVEIPKFSTDASDADRVTKYMNTQGYTLRIRHMAQQGEYKTMFWKEDGQNYVFSKAKTLPLAICVAALDAIEGINVRKKKSVSNVK